MYASRYASKAAFRRSFSTTSDSFVLLVALGGNALLQKDKPLSFDNQLQQIRSVVPHFARLLAHPTPESRLIDEKDHKKNMRIILTHGNGPQAGLRALQSLSYKDVEPYPLDVLVAETVGQIGYTLSQELTNSLRTEFKDRQAPSVCTVLTQVLVDKNDPFMNNPTKYIGPSYSKEESDSLGSKYGWSMKLNEHGKYRRVVPSPLPQSIVEISSIKTLVDSGSVVIALGGGGVCCVEDENTGSLNGLEAIVDKDLSSAMLAEQLDADAMIILTDESNVYSGYKTENEKKLGEVKAEELQAIIKSNPNAFPPGSMGPKVDALLNFINAPRSESKKHKARFAAIGNLADLENILLGEAGTIVRSDVRSKL